MSPGALIPAGPLLKRLALPNGSFITNNESVGRLEGTLQKKSDGTILNRHEYTYNVAGQREQQIRTDDTFVDYDFDRIVKGSVL